MRATPIRRLHGDQRARCRGRTRLAERARRPRRACSREYNVAWNWRSPGNDGDGRRTALNQRLTGTYQLDSGQGDDRGAGGAAGDARAATHAAAGGIQAPHEPAECTGDDRHRAQGEQHHHGVVARTAGHLRRPTARCARKQGGGGRTMETRATLSGDQLMVTTTGNRGSDYAVTFEPLDNGRNMRVTRRIQDDTLRQPVTVHSFYRKIVGRSAVGYRFTEERTVNGAHAVPHGLEGRRDGHAGWDAAGGHARQRPEHAECERRGSLHDDDPQSVTI